MAVLKNGAEDSAESKSDRRRSRRRPLHDVPSLLGVSLKSQAVEVIDVSAGGLLIQSGCRMLPGEASQVDILHVDGPRRVRGRVVRSEVAALSQRGLKYRTAIMFESSLECVDGEAALAAPEALVGTFADLLLSLDPSRSPVSEAFMMNAW